MIIILFLIPLSHAGENDVMIDQLEQALDFREQQYQKGEITKERYLQELEQINSMLKSLGVSTSKTNGSSSRDPQIDELRATFVVVFNNFIFCENCNFPVDPAYLFINIILKRDRQIDRQK